MNIYYEIILGFINYYVNKIILSIKYLWHISVNFLKSQTF